MKKKTQNFIFNSLMMLAIISVAVCGVFVAGSVKGWFNDGSDDVSVVSSGANGIVQIVRSGVSFELENGTVLRAGDKVKTFSASGVTLMIGESKIILDENTEISVSGDAAENAGILLENGQFFADISQNNQVCTDSADIAVHSKDSVYGMSVFPGAVNISVFCGQVTAQAGEYSYNVNLEDSAVFTTDTDNKISAEISRLYAGSLGEFLLASAIDAASAGDICFDKTELEKIVSDRNAEKLAMGDVSGSIEGDNDGSQKKYCTVTISCETILDNLSSLDASKTGYVPKDGMILEPTKVYFYEGETAFDVLKRVCDAMEIQLEYSWTPIYNSHYVEGINHLYEFDCGPESGWMYKAEGWFPNYGASSYKLKDGDNIVWSYTCRLGEDVGSKM